MSFQTLSHERSKFNWYVVYTYPNYEKKVSKISSKFNIECFLPTTKVIRQWSDRKKTINIPLFPNYVFVYITSIDLYKMLDIPGVYRYVTFDGKPVTLLDREIENIRNLTQYSDVTIESELVEGALVKIIDGPFTGAEGTLIQRNGKTRVALEINALNQILSIVISDLSIIKLAV